MATRSGDVDPTIPLYLQKHCGLSASEVDTLLNKKSGLAGLCGNSDLRSVLADDSPQAKLAIEVWFTAAVFVSRGVVLFCSAQGLVTSRV